MLFVVLFSEIMLECWGCGLYMSAAYTRVFTVFKFLDTLLFVIVPRMVWQNFTKIRQICIPYKFGQSGNNPQKILDLSSKRFVNNWRAKPGDCLAVLARIKPQTSRTRPPGLASIAMDEDFHGKALHCNTFSISLSH